MDKEEFLAALRNDPQAALALGCRIVATADVDDRRQADVPFEIARNGDPTTAWYAADAYAQEGDGAAARWMAVAAASLGDPDGIVVDPMTLPIHIDEYDVDRWIVTHQDWQIAVRCDDPARAIAALKAAERRLGSVANDGSVQPAGIYGLTGPPGPWYTPNCVVAEGDVPLIWLDCKDGVFPLMARTILEIIIEELRTAGITRAELSTP